MKRLCMGCMKEYDDQFDICPYCGYAFNTPPEQSYHIPPGSVLQQHYIVGRVLGFGGFGVTYVGKDYLMDRKVAIKEYLPSEFATRMPTQQQVTVYSGDKEEQFREGLAKTLEEARRLAKFENVPGIVQIYDCFEANGTSYIVMEYLEGMSLKKYLAEHGKMTAEQALPVILQIASAMEEVHKTGILHRDIAPDNICVLNPDEPDNLKVKLLDFGAARYATTKHSKSLSVIIKPGYAPEEQYRSRGDQGTWTDVYALAATLYKMLTGVTPEDSMERSVKDELKKPSKMGVKIKKSTETAVMNALNVKIQDRTQTMEEFSRELMAAEVTAKEVTEDDIPIKPIPKWFFFASGLGISVIGVILALIFTGVINFNLSSGSAHLPTGTVRVPNVINKEADSAEVLLKENELGMSRDRMVYSKEIPQNMISYQDIKESTTVEKNTTITVWISMGEEKAVIPNVTGLNREEALKRLKKEGFTNIREEESQDKGVFDSVLGISEKQGSNVELSKEIVLTICKNEADQNGDDKAKVTVPDVVGKRKAQAESMLTEAGLLINWVEENSDKPEGTILSQMPEADEEVNKDSFITIHVSIGAEKIYMKNVILKTRAEAEEVIGELGLSVGRIKEQYSDSVARGCVISQSIEQDEEVKKGDKVDLVISLGVNPANATKAPKQTPARQTPAPQTQTPAPQTPAPAPETPAPAPETPAPAPETPAPAPETPAPAPQTPAPAPETPAPAPETPAPAPETPAPQPQTTAPQTTPSPLPF